MFELNTRTVNEIAQEIPAATVVFDEFKIDYCNCERLSFDDACRIAKANPKIVAEKISQICRLCAGTDYGEWKSISELIDYIVEKHHRFTRDAIGRLTLLIEKVCYKHKTRHAELLALRSVFRNLSDDLTAHMRKEEFILFPFIKSLERAEQPDLWVPYAPFGVVQNPIRTIISEHETAREFLSEMQEITGGYTVPKDACTSFEALYLGFRELEKDLRRHIHLENNILFPRAIELEQKIL